MEVTDGIDPIGGYFELDLPQHDFPHADAILLNSGRACIEHILRANDVRHVYVPKYTCDVVLEPLVALAISWSFYSIDGQLKIAEPVSLGQGEYIIANNYFGVRDEYCQQLARLYGRNLILDCSQAFFAAPPRSAQCFYTPRKFFGVPDGGMLCTDRTLDIDLEVDSSWARSSHLLKRIDLGAENAFADFQRNDASLGGQGMKRLSPLTRKLLGAIDYDEALRRRKRNYEFLLRHLKPDNRLEISEDNACPMVFPYLNHRPGLRRKLVEHKIFVATYWPNVFDWCDASETEHHLAEYLLPLPIDQRYGIEDMDRILSVLE